MDGKRKMVARVRVTIDVPFDADVDDLVVETGVRPSPLTGEDRHGLLDAAAHERNAAAVEKQRRNAAKHADKVITAEIRDNLDGVVDVVVEEVRDA